MKELVEYIVKSLVDSPNEVQIEEVEAEGGFVLKLRVDRSDLGKVIGKQGRTARAIRTILNAAGVKQQKRMSLEILED